MYKTVEKELRAYAKKRRIAADGEKIRETIQAVDKILYANGLCESDSKSTEEKKRLAGQKREEAEKMPVWAALVQKYGKRRVMFVADAVCICLLTIAVCAVYVKLQNGGGEEHVQIAKSTQTPEDKERKSAAPEEKEQQSAAPKETQPAPARQEDGNPSAAPASDAPATEAAPAVLPQAEDTVLAEGNSDNNSTNAVTSDASVTVADDAFEYNILIDGNEYGSAGVVLGNGLLGNTIGELPMTIKEWDEGTQVLGERSVICDIYEIAGIDPVCAVAVRPREGKYAASNQVFVRYEIQPETWGEFKRVCNFDNLVTINPKSDICIQNASGLVLASYQDSKELVWQQLQTLSDESTLVTDEMFLLMNEYMNGVTESLSIGMDAPVLGVENHTITIYDTGYLFTNILGGHVYYIGTDAANEMICFVKERAYIYDEPIPEKAHE